MAKAKFVIAGTMQEYDDYVKRKVTMSDPRPGMGVRPSDFIEVSGVEIFKHAKEDAQTPIKGVFIGTYKSRPDILDITTKIKEINNIPLTYELFPGEKELWKKEWAKRYQDQSITEAGILPVGQIQYNPYTNKAMVVTPDGLLELTSQVPAPSADGQIWSVE